MLGTMTITRTQDFRCFYLFIFKKKKVKCSDMYPTMDTTFPSRYIEILQ